MNRPGSAMTRAKQTKGSTGAPIMSKPVEEKPLDAATFIKNRDWVGATTFLELEKSVTDTKHDNALWLAFCYFHNGEYQRAIKIYDELLKKPDANKEWHIYKGCCHFALCAYDDAKRDVLKGPETPLQTRLLFHIAHKKNDEKSLMDCHHKLEETTSDQLCLGAIHYLRGHYEEAIDIYKKLLLENRDNLALNVYVALCYYKLDYYDVSLEILSSYLNTNPTSVMAVNLKACNQHQLYNGKAAEMELKVLQQNYETGNVFQDNDLLRHNLVVFRNGENAQQVMPPLLDVFPEARLNLILYHIKNDDVTSAMELLKELEPSTPREYIIKAVVHAVLGQKMDSKDHIKTAQQLYQMIGISASECDTIPGRQCMASFFFLVKQFDDVLVYLKSIRQFFQNDDDFNWNFGIASASANEFNDAEEAFSLITSEKLKSDYIYVSWYSRVLIMNGKPHQAWELYVNMENANESLSLLQVIANDCYRMGHFYYAAKAFDLLERMDQDPEHTEGKKGAVVGLFQMVIAGKEEPQHLVDGLNMMKNAGNNPQVEYMLKVIKKWGKENGLQIQ